MPGKNRYYAVTMYAEMIGRYFELLKNNGPIIALLSCVPILSYLIWKKFGRYLPKNRYPYISRLLLLIACSVGLFMALSKAALFDDAFISFRYADNFARGHGLVFNPGERVEGYSNFLWTLLMGIISAVTTAKVPAVGLVMSVVAFLCNFAIVYRVGQLLQQDRLDRPYIPVAALLISLHPVITDYGTSGLETGAVSLLTNLGLYYLLSASTLRGMFISGLFFCLAVFTRPDHVIFYVAAGITITIPLVVSVRRAENTKRRAILVASLKKLLAFGGPVIFYLAYLVWKYVYYGSILPNTYYAKSAGDDYFVQGLIYDATFLLGTHGWLLLLFLILTLAWPSRNSMTTRLKLFTAISFPLFVFYITKVGGDFMYGRFFVTLVPIALLNVENWIYTLKDKGQPSLKKTWAALLVVALLFATSTGVPIIGEKVQRWRVTNESSFYRIVQAFPVVMELDGNRRFSTFLNQCLKKRGISPVIASGSIGVLAYYSDLEIIDFRGLTDRYVAHRPVKRRGVPGHEKTAPLEYLNDRGVSFGRIHQRIPNRFIALTELEFDGQKPNGWRMITYRRDLMQRIAQKCPKMTFVDFEVYLDRYIKNLNRKTPAEVAADLLWFEQYYFNHNDDEKRHRVLRNYSKIK